MKLHLNASSWPEKFTCSFIEPGLVSYENEGLGKCYVDKPALDKMAPSFIGKPVVSAKDHVDGMTPADLEKVAKGYITNVYWKDNWYWADMLITDDQAKKDIKSGKFSVSCAYNVKDADDKGGIRNNIDYDQEILDGFYIHMALVTNPRYNGAKILLNSTGGKSSMKIKGWFKKLLNATAKNEISPEDTVDVDGEKVSIGDLTKSVEEEEKEALAAAEEPKEQEIDPDATLQIGGKEVSLQNAITTYKNRKAKKNAADEEAKKKEDEEALAKKNADEEAEAAKKKEEEETKKNSSHFLSLKNAAEGRHTLSGPTVQITEDKRARGVELYGKK